MKALSDNLIEILEEDLGIGAKRILCSPYHEAYEEVFGRRINVLEEMVPDNIEFNHKEWKYIPLPNGWKYLLKDKPFSLDNIMSISDQSNVIITSENPINSFRIEYDRESLQKIACQTEHSIVDSRLFDMSLQWGVEVKLQNTTSPISFLGAEQTFFAKLNGGNQNLKLLMKNLEKYLRNYGMRNQYIKSVLNVFK